MEWVAATDAQLDRVARRDERLAPFFAGVFACDRLPWPPVRDRPQGYIVNTDPHDRPGRHWLAVWTEPEEECELMDSYALPLETYGSEPLERWLSHHWSVLKTNRQSLQTVTSWTCGHYALMYLCQKSRGRSLSNFLSDFSPHDYVQNDHRVSAWFARRLKPVSL